MTKILAADLFTPATVVRKVAVKFNGHVMVFTSGTAAGNGLVKFQNSRGKFFLARVDEPITLINA